MSLETLLEILAWVFGVMFTFFMGYLAWLFKRLHAKVEDSVSRKDLEAVETKMMAVISEKEAAATKEILSVKEDTRSMADSVVNAVKSLEDRLDTLMFHLMNQGGKK